VGQVGNLRPIVNRPARESKQASERFRAMLKVWHKNDAFDALQRRGWIGPVVLGYPKEWNYVGEAWSFSRANWTLNLYFIADYGTGYHGIDSIESIAGRLVGDSSEYGLWLRRTRDARWKSSVIEWADQLSADRHADRGPQPGGCSSPD
jgi:hypothetical protein